MCRGGVGEGVISVGAEIFMVEAAMRGRQRMLYFSKSDKEIVITMDKETRAGKTGIVLR